jgi:hypothetical protein
MTLYQTGQANSLTCVFLVETRNIAFNLKSKLLWEAIIK